MEGKASGLAWEEKGRVVSRREGERGRRGQQEKTTKTRGKVDMEWRTSDRAVAWEETERVVWMGMSRGAAAVPRLQAAGAKGAGKERTAREESEEDKEEGGMEWRTTDWAWERGRRGWTLAATLPPFRASKVGKGWEAC